MSQTPHPDIPTDLAAEAPPDHQGRVVTDADPAALIAGIETAFDYRGDVKVVRHSATEAVEGYLFDRRRGETLESSCVRVVSRADGCRVTISYADIRELRFTGRDTAAGKSFETWMRKYVEKKLAGETASIEAEPLDGEA